MRPPATFGELAGRLRQHVAKAGRLSAADWVALLKAPAEIPLQVQGGRFRAVTFDVRGGVLVVTEDWELVGS